MLPDNKQQQLRRAKRIALFWLVGAAFVFILATLAEYRQWITPWPAWAGLIKMASEAALVGGLAEGLSDDPVKASDSLHASLRSLVDLWVDGLRKRNERVQSAAASPDRFVTGRAGS